MADATAPSAPAMPTFERVPRAEGSLPRGWLAVANPFRKRADCQRTMAAWAGATTNAWIAWSLIVAAAIDACSGYLGTAYTTTKGKLSIHEPGLAGIGSGATGVLFHLTECFAIALTTTRLLTLLRYGTFRSRFVRMLRPWALAQPAIAVAGLLSVLTSLVQVHVSDINAPILGGTFTLLMCFELLAGFELVLLFFIVGLTQTSLAVGAYRFMHYHVLVLLALITWVATYFGYHALTGWIEYVLRIGGS